MSKSLSDRPSFSNSRRPVSSRFSKICRNSPAFASLHSTIWVFTLSCARSDISRPKAEATPGEGGTMTVGILNCSATLTMWIGPAPPKAITAYSRGSMPRDTVISRTALPMWMLASW